MRWRPAKNLRNHPVIAWLVCYCTFAACGGRKGGGDAGEPYETSTEMVSPAEDAGGELLATPGSTIDGNRGRKPLYVVVGGDVILQDQIKDVATRHAFGGDKASGWKWFFHAIEPVIERYRKKGEVAFVVNLESPVASERVPTASFPPRFNGPPEALVGMRRAGIGCVMLANNHALDQGRAGLSETIEAARKAGLAVVGAGIGEEARRPQILGGENGAPQVALFAYLVRNRGGAKEVRGRPTVALYNERSLVEVSDAAAADGVDGVVVSLHWIGEFIERPLPRWEEIAFDLVAAGADAVVCHGPHVVGPAGWVEAGGRKGFVAYSLGNLLANFGWEVYPGSYKNLQKGATSARRIESRGEALCVLEFAAGTAGEVELTKVFMHPLWLEDNRYASFRNGGSVRAIYPMPIPSCVPPPEVGCPAGAFPKECSHRWEMIFLMGKRIVEDLWGGVWNVATPCSGVGSGAPAMESYHAILPSIVVDWVR